MAEIKQTETTYATVTIILHREVNTDKKTPKESSAQTPRMRPVLDFPSFARL